jgi:predicted permease
MSDLRVAARALARTPVISGIAVLSLATGIGANTAIFGILNALDLRTLPLPHPEQLIWLRTFPPDAQNNINIITGRPNPQPLSGAMFEELRTHRELFSDLFGFGWNDSNVRNLEAHGAKYPGSLSQVTGNYFAAVGARPLLGRLIGPGDFAMHLGASAPVAVLDFRGWQRLFGGDPAVVGKTVRVDGVPLTVIGVTARDFVGLNIDHSAEVTAPLGYDGSTDFRRRDYLTLNVVGRLAPGIELGRAQAGLATLWPRILESSAPEQFTGQRRARFFARRLDVQSIARGTSNLRDRLSAPLRILIWLVAVVLLMACANTANLLLSRAATRRHELAVRAALGASRWRIIRPLLTEGLLISAVGALTALPVAVWSSRTLIRMVWTGYTPLTLDPAPDWRVILFTAGITIAAAVLFSVAPAWLAMGVGPAGALGHNQRTVRGGRDGLGRVLISGQIALALLMTVAALLFVRTIHNLRFAEAGFDLNSILVIQLFPQTAHGKVPNRPVYYRRLAEELARLTGVEAVSYSNTAIPILRLSRVTRG